MARRRQKKALTEITPYYLCTDVAMTDAAGYERLYYSVSQFAFSKGIVDGNRISDETQRDVLKLVESKFRDNDVSCGPCYLDCMAPGEVNVGIYFDSEAERDAFTEKLGDELSILSKASFNEGRGEYEETFTVIPKSPKQFYPGHEKKRVKFRLKK